MFYGTIGQIDFLIEKVIAETGFVDQTVVATGGLAEGINSHSKFIRSVDQNLTLEGLRIIAEGR
jgi:type III pantothenate kinase